MDDAVLEVEELSTLVAELVDLATDARRSTEDWREIRLDEIVERAAERTRRHHRREVVLELEPTTVLGSAGLLERAVTNLLDNAGKWSPPDGRVQAVLADRRLRVLDDGPGVAEADQERLWDRFWRADGSQDVPGSGLGLAIVREVVEAHGGTVHAAARPEGGLDIGFTLPAPPPRLTGGRASCLASPGVTSRRVGLALAGAVGTLLAGASPAAAHGAGALERAPVAAMAVLLGDRRRGGDRLLRRRVALAPSACSMARPTDGPYRGPSWPGASPSWCGWSASWPTS